MLTRGRQRLGCKQRVHKTARCGLYSSEKLFSNRQRNGVSVRIVPRRLRTAGIRSRQPAQRPRLEARHIQARLRWARHHVNWTSSQWVHIVFSAKKKQKKPRLLLERYNGRSRVFGRPGERFASACILQVATLGSVVPLPKPIGRL